MTKPLFTISLTLLVSAANFCYAQKPVISYSSPQSYLVGIPITPVVPSNTGGPAGAPKTIVLGSGFVNPTGVAVDAPGNVYFTATANNLVAKIPAGGGIPITLGTGFNMPTGVAVDAAGNVYVADFGNGVVKKIPAGGGPVVEIAPELISPYGIAIDASGNLFVSDDGDNTVKEITPGGGAPVIIGSGFNTPAGLAVDTAGTVIVADRGNNLIKKILRGGVMANIAPGNGNPNGVAVDAAGNIYFADTNNQSIIEILRAGGSPVSIAPGLSTPAGLAATASGIIYIDDTGNGAVKKYDRGSFAINTPLPTGLFFDIGTGKISGTPAIVSAAKTYIVTGTNSFGSSTASINIKVNNPVKPNISYAGPQVYTAGIPIVPLVPVNTGDGVAPGDYYIVPILPWGLVFDTNTGIISGTPSESSVANNYAIIATNQGGRSVTSLKITVNPPLKPSISYAGPQTCVVGRAISISSVNSGGEVAAGRYSITPALPPGLIFNTYTGTISGKPTVASPAKNYTVNAYNAGGSSTCTVNISVHTGINLNGLALSKGVLSPEFTPGVNVYSASVSSSTASITLTPVTDDPAATVKVNGMPVTSGSASTAIALAVGPNIITTTITTADGVVTNTYTVTVTRVSTNAKLLTIKTNPKTTLTGVTGPGYGNYTTTVPYSESSVTLTSTAADTTATIKVNGITVASGAASQPVPLAVGDNVITIIVTAQDGIATKTYYITATRMTSPIATLSDLALSAGTLSPGFATVTTDYTAIVPNAASSIKITPAVTDAHAAIKVNGVSVASGASLIFPLAVGTNAITTVVTAQDGTSTETYTVTVTRVAAGMPTNAKLLTIKTNPKSTLTGIAGPGYGNYITAVPFSESSLKLTPTAADANATIKVNGTAVASGAASQPIPLAVGDNVIATIVTAQDGATTKSYFITATRAGSPVDTLSSLAISKGTLSPAFAPATTSYTAIVPYTASSIKITPQVMEAHATVKINGVAVASGGSLTFPLAVGTNTLVTVVTAPDGIATKAYTVTVTRVASGPSTEAKLDNIIPYPRTDLIRIKGPGFGNYTTSVRYNESHIALNLVAADATATIKVNGATVASGADSQPIPLNIGDNVITIIVTAQDGATTKTYYITATRAAASSLATLALSAGTLSPVFGQSPFGSYAAIVPNAASSIKLTPVSTDPYATVKVEGLIVASGASPSFPLAVGINGISIEVTDQYHIATEFYTLNITRAAAGLSTEARLLTIKPNPKTILTVVPGPGFGNYTTAAPYTEKSVTLTPTAIDTTATIKIDNTLVASGAASPAIPLSAGKNVIPIIVTSQDGATTNTYYVTVTKAPSPIAGLSSLVLSEGTLSPVFATTITGYTAIVPNATSSIKITPAPTEVRATIKVNGIAVASRVASPAIPLAVGTNTITIVVTAQDGINTKAYTLTVTRAEIGQSPEARLLTIKPNPKTTLTVVAGPGFGNYTTTVPNSESSVTLTSTAIDANATIKVNGTPVASGAASQSIPLNVGDNVITIIVTAQDGATTKTYYITATRATGSMVAQYADGHAGNLKTDGIVVHQGVSPNGDGDNDVLTIDGIAAYPDNSLQIMNGSGALVYEAKGYDNTSKVFDGHSISNGKLQQAGTYFYSLDYKDGAETKHKTGFIVLKY